MERLEQDGKLGGSIKVIAQELCNVHLIPLNRTTLKFYGRLDKKNMQEWHKAEEKEGKSDR